jgi:hypothetical protein
VDADLIDDLQRDGFMFGVKLSLSRRLLGLTRSLELFQSLQAGQRGQPGHPEASATAATTARAEVVSDRPSLGCLDHTGQWHEGAVFYRNTVTLGRLKLYWNNGLIFGRSILGTQSAHCRNP